MPPEVVVAAICWVVAVYSIVREPPFSPVQLWAIPWAAATTLYALRLLPYTDMSLKAAAIMSTSIVAFAVGAVIVGRRRPRDNRELMVREPLNRRVIEFAAGLSVAVTAVICAAFVLQIARAYGLRSTLITDPTVRGVLGEGEFAVTIKYVYVALAGSVLCAIAAAAQDVRRRRRLWLGGAAFCVLSLYFSTGRGNLVLAGISAWVTFELAKVYGRPGGRRGIFGGGADLSRRRAILGVAAASVFASAALLAGGQLIGKTYENSEVSQFYNAFSQREQLAPLALPYQYASAPIGAFSYQVNDRLSWGSTDGCSTFAIGCAVLQAAGFDTKPEEGIREFTNARLPWNTYTALDLPLLDFGPFFVPLIMFLTGLAVGLMWAGVRAATVQGLALYGVFAAALFYSPVQYNFLGPQFVGAGVLVVLFIAAGRAWNADALRAARESRLLAGRT